MENIVDRAINFATKAHENQRRKFGDRPYIVHPIGVAEFVAITKLSKKKDLLLVVAILHDIIEDTEYNKSDILKLFGKFVADLVEELTSDKLAIKLIGKKEYLLQKMIGMSSYALVIKLADVLYNLLDCNCADDKFKSNIVDRTKFLIFNLEKYRQLTPTHYKLIKMITIKLEEYEKAI